MFIYVQEEKQEKQSEGEEQEHLFCVVMNYYFLKFPKYVVC